MRILKLHLRAFGPFTGRILDFGINRNHLVLVHGANEAGKSSALRAISDLRFGIPTQSKDDFVHSHPTMRIGGEFVDRDGKSYSLLRRKGRTETLHVTDFSSAGSARDTPAAPEIELLLNCGLTKVQHDSMFGIDHQALRKGGEALLNGEGEVGAALFEASAGGRSVPEILTRLDGSARTYFMAGSRARNAKINEALLAYERHQVTFRNAQIRPGVWTELAKKQKTAAEQLSALERRSQDIHGELLLVRELRSVALLLATLENASAAAAELASSRLLDIHATTDRVTAERGLADAHHNALSTAADLERYTAQFHQPSIDSRILDIAPAVQRFISSAETIDEHRRNIVQAKMDVEALTQDLSRFAKGIAPDLAATDTVAKVPSKVERAVMEEKLSAVEHARRAIEQHRGVASRPAVSPAFATAEPPRPEVRAALNVAQGQVTRAEVDLKRLAVLPTEIKGCERTVTRALLALNAGDAATFAQLRPLFDAQIDAALQQANEHQTRRTGFVSRHQAVNQAIQTTMEQRDRLSAAGEVATWKDVMAARALRESAWERVRRAYIESPQPFVNEPSDGKPLPLAYAAAVQEADRLVDAFASDTKRATELQATQDKLSGLERDRDELDAQLAVTDRDHAERTSAWEQLLASARLPSLPPAALRDWQALIPAARTAIENLQAKSDELDRMQHIENTLAGQLRQTIRATGLAAPAADATLGALIGTASEIEQGFQQQEMARTRTAGEDAARAEHARKWISQGADLAARSEAADAGLQSSVGLILLPQGASEKLVRARLAEFVQLSDVWERLTAAQRHQSQAEQSVTQLKASAQPLWEHLADSAPADLRIYSEQLADRLAAAEAARSAQRLAEHAAHTAKENLRNHQVMAKRYQDAIAELCRAAAVESAAALPAAEEMSRRKREAQDTIDRTRAQLALASRRTIEELRALVQSQDTAQMDATESSLTHDREALKMALAAAREADELARRELNAIDSSDVAVVAREAMERAASSVRASMAPWIRSKIAHSLLTEALRRFRDRAQGPMLIAASSYFAKMTRNRFVRLLSDDSDKEIVLVALRDTGARVQVQEMSEGTRDQLYLALRLAALDLRRAPGVDLPILLDDILITSDDDRSAAILQALSEAAKSHQVIVFTHHHHIADIAMRSLSADRLHMVTLN